MTEYFKIGKFVAAHGLKGEILLKHELGKESSFKGIRALFIEEKNGTFLPYFIAYARIKSANEVYLKLENVYSRESAQLLASKTVWLPEPDFKKAAARNAPAGLLGYTVINMGEKLGEILELIEQPHQLLCRLEINAKEVLIPLHDETLQKINHKKKEVIVTLPEGLLAIYLGNS